jgi:hypothetical protein
VFDSVWNMGVSNRSLSVCRPRMVKITCFQSHILKAYSISTWCINFFLMLSNFVVPWPEIRACTLQTFRVEDACLTEVMLPRKITASVIHPSQISRTSRENWLKVSVFSMYICVVEIILNVYMSLSHSLHQQYLLKMCTNYDPWYSCLVVEAIFHCHRNICEKQWRIIQQS